MENGGREQMLSVRMRLLKEMKEGVYRYAERLPRENVLAERLRISRTQLRDSLAQLEREGFITRRHGVGTVINRHVLEIRSRMDMEIEFADMIRQSGYVPELASVKWETRRADETATARLKLSEGAEMLCVSRLMNASGTPAIYCEDCIPLSLIKGASYAEADFHAPIFSFLKTFCGVEPYMDITEIRPTCANKALAALFHVKEGTALLYMDELDFDIEGAPILYSPQYYIGGVIKHTLMRKRF
ncbi:MAG TPA: GntR family transcriptional regulator [Clostridia bacterium]|nr:GntR family transcriptional regulator [Clostridia bacterium]